MAAKKKVGRATIRVRVTLTADAVSPTRAAVSPTLPPTAEAVLPTWLGWG